MEEFRPDPHALELAKQRAGETRKLLMEIVLPMGVELAGLARTHGLAFARRDEELEAGEGIAWMVHVHYAKDGDMLSFSGHPLLPSAIGGEDYAELAVEVARVMGTQDGKFQFFVPRTWATAAAVKLGELAGGG